MSKRIKAFFRRIVDSGKSVRAKIFILLTIIGMISLILALIADIILQENAGEIIALLITVIFAPVVTYLAVRYERIQLGATVVAAFVVFFVVPTVFYFGGGLTGGGIIWFVFAYLYIGIILVGTTRIVMMSLLTILIIATGFEKIIILSETLIGSTLIWNLGGYILIILILTVVFDRNNIKLLLFN